MFQMSVVTVMLAPLAAMLLGAIWSSATWGLLNLVHHETQLVSNLIHRGSKLAAILMVKWLWLICTIPSAGQSCRTVDDA